jgi:hypothetical protein
MLGYADIVILEVTLDRHEDDALGRFGAELAALPEVLEAYLVSGEYDYWIKVAVDGTAGYERFLREKLYRISSIRHSRSMFALRCMKDVPSIRCDDAGAARAWLGRTTVEVGKAATIAPPRPAARGIRTGRSGCRSGAPTAIESG